MNGAAKQGRVSAREELAVGYVVSECFSRLSGSWTRLLHLLQLEPVVVPATFFKKFLLLRNKNKMPGPNQGSSGMGYERKKRNLTAIPITSPTAASSAANYRVGQHSATGNGYPSNPRSPSPPASAYFPLLSAQDTTSRLRPTPNAEAHFAYSTTLRRHQSDTAAALASPAEFAAAVNAEAAGLWTRTINTITGRGTNEYQQVGRETPPIPQREETKDTASGKFAHLTVEVNSTCLLSFFHLF